MAAHLIFFPDIIFPEALYECQAHPKLLGRVELLIAGSMLLPLGVSLLYGESPLPFLTSIAVLLCTCLPLSLMRTGSGFFLRDGFAAVGLIWLLVSVAGALPFYFSGEFSSFTDCLFESASGFTTTGATILADIEACSKGILFWRSLTHWWAVWAY